jgi:WD40 repeat protein
LTSDGRQTTRWNLDDGRSTVLATTPGVLGKVTRLTVDPAGNLLVIGADSGASSIWDLPSGRRMAILQTPVALKSLSFSADGKELLAAGTYAYRWQIDPQGWLKWICSVTQRNLTVDEARTLGVEVPTPRVCPSSS